MEDKKLIKRCQIGDKAAFQELIAKYHPFVYKFLIKLTGSEQLSDDLTQDTFIKLIRNIEKFEVEGKALFSTYLITISKHCYIDYLRKERKYSNNLDFSEQFAIQDISMDVESKVIDKLLSGEVLEKMEELTEEQKIAIKMKYVEGLTLQEIGDKLNLEAKTVKSRIHNGIVKLRKIFNKED